jgi:hypothetical protein
VTLAAVAERTSLIDRVLLTVGRWWLQRTFDRALANLARVLAAGRAGEEEPATASFLPALERKAG